MLRRLFLKRVAEVFIVFTGVVLGFRWVKIGLVNNNGATPAARTFNQAISEHRTGHTNLQKARKKAANEAWEQASQFYTEAHIQYYEAQGKYQDAHQAANKVNCENLSTIARQYMGYCDHMEDACEMWAKAADMRIKQKTEIAKAQLKKANKQHKTAISLVDTPIPNERDVHNPTC